MRRDPRAYLWDALAAMDSILEFTRGRSLDDYWRMRCFDQQSSVSSKSWAKSLSQLAKTEPTIAQHIPDIGAIVAFRNMLIHGYAAVDHRTVWRTIEEDLENLRNRLRVLLSEREDIP
jgi:uncharacterized protein with HEPN domain